MFEKKVKEEKIHDLNLQPRICSHPINARIGYYFVVLNAIFGFGTEYN